MAEAMLAAVIVDAIAGLIAHVQTAMDRENAICVRVVVNTVLTIVMEDIWLIVLYAKAEAYVSNAEAKEASNETICLEHLLWWIIKD